MRVAKWQESLETGDVEVDNQHRALYVLVNDLNADALLGDDPTQSARALERILRYATTHFATEEQLMERSGYPQAEQHIAIHNEFTRAAAEMVAAHNAGHGLTARELAQFMENWLEEHIQKEDRPLIGHVRAWRTS